MKKRPLPRQYWQLIGLIVFLLIIIFSVLLIVLYLTEGRELHEFTGEDWLYWITFVCTGSVFLLLSFLVAKEARMILSGHDRQTFRSLLHDGPQKFDGR